MNLKRLMPMTVSAIFFSWSPVSSAGNNVVINQAEKAGLHKCLPAVKTMSEFIIGDGSAGASSIWNSKNPDGQIFSTSVERNYSDSIIFTDMTIAPVASGDCAAVYTKIFYQPKSCLAVAKETYEKATYKGVVNKEVAYLDHDGVDVFLMPAGQGCVVVRKEAMMNVTSKGK